MTPQALKETLSSLITQKLPAFIWGPSGIGKTSIVKEIAEDMGVNFSDICLTSLDPSDLRSRSFLNKGEAVWFTPSFLPKLDEKGGILFLGDLNLAHPSVQAAAYQLILDRRIGEYLLPDNWAIIASGNRDSDGQADMLPSLANRFVHFEMEFSIDDWKHWAFREKLDDAIISFISLHHDALFTFDPASKEKAFATPRSWKFVDTILKSKMKDIHLLESISGAIGKTVATQFLAYMNDSWELPMFQEIFDGRSQHYPKDEMALSIMATVLVSNALRKPDKKVLNHLLHYTINLDAKFAMMIIDDLYSQGVRFNRLEAWKAWSEKFSYSKR